MTEPATSGPRASMTAKQISDILERQHSKDVFVRECKDGPTWTTTHARMDCWTMTRSWVRLVITGYEIKLSRSDFLSDKKWQEYLPLCNQLYFVCPKGLIVPGEMPDGIGLKWCTERRANTVKKAAHREVVIPECMYQYILMSRTRIVPPHFYEQPTRERRIEEWREWLAQKQDARKLGWRVSKAVRERADAIEAQARIHELENRTLQDVRDILAELGVTVGQWEPRASLKDRLAAALSAVPPELMEFLVRLEQEAAEARKSLEVFREKADRRCAVTPGLALA